MAKSIIKEIVLVILILAVVVLLFGIIFYDFIPSSKVIPSVISYKTPENVSSELADYSASAGQQNVMVSYSIDGQDLSVYEQSNEYSKGKQNPFGSSSDGQTGAPDAGTANSTGTTNTSAGNVANTKNPSTSNKQQNTSNQEGTFYKSTGMK